MTTIPKEILLYDYINEVDFKAKFTKLNGLKYSELADIESQFRDTTKEANILFMMAQSDPETLKKTFESNPETKPFKMIINQILDGKIGITEIAQLFEQMTPEIVKSNHEKNIEIIKLMINEKSLTKKQVELINKDEFWLEQDVLLLGDCANSFRSVVKGS